MPKFVNVGDEINVNGKVFVLVEMTEKRDGPATVVFKQPSELMPVRNMTPPPVHRTLRRGQIDISHDMRVRRYGAFTDGQECRVCGLDTVETPDGLAVTCAGRRLV